MFKVKNKRVKIWEKSEINVTKSTDLHLKLNDICGSTIEFNISSMKAMRAKTEDEIKFLEEQFAIDPTWSRKTVQIWKKALGMRTDQVYKWGYDRKQTIERKFKRSGRISDQNRMKAIKINKSIDLNSLVTLICETVEQEENLTITSTDNLQSDSVKNFGSGRNSINSNFYHNIDWNKSELSQKDRMWQGHDTLLGSMLTWRDTNDISLNFQDNDILSGSHLKDFDQAFSQSSCQEMQDKIIGKFDHLFEKKERIKENEEEEFLNMFGYF